MHQAQQINLDLENVGEGQSAMALHIYVLLLTDLKVQLLHILHTTQQIPLTFQHVLCRAL